MIKIDKTFIWGYPHVYGNPHVWTIHALCIPAPHILLFWVACHSFSKDRDQTEPSCFPFFCMFWSGASSNLLQLHPWHQPSSTPAWRSCTVGSCNTKLSSRTRPPALAARGTPSRARRRPLGAVIRAPRQLAPVAPGGGGVKGCPCSKPWLFAGWNHHLT